MNKRRTPGLMLPLLLLLGAWQGSVRAAPPHAAGQLDLTELSLEDLMKEPVTSVSKRATPLSDSAAAIAVITQDDIRRSGVTTLAEALRMAPGLDVARINANQWAISSRGFNHQFARTLQVLIDGRSVYTPIGAGVHWNAQDTVLADIERIEVIRGPGATLWGANAVNGVINIITKRAAQTQGAIFTAVAGTEERPMTSLRYGGAVGKDLHFRVYGKYFNREGYDFEDGSEAHDDWHTLRGGFRLDWEPGAAGDDGRDSFTLQGDTYRGKAGLQIDGAGQGLNVRQDNHGTNLIARWTRNFSPTSVLTVQGYVDHTLQGDSAGPGGAHIDVYDLDAQHRFTAGANHEVLWGLGYRVSEVSMLYDPLLTWTQDEYRVYLFNVFMQDEIALDPTLRLTLGTKLEHNSLERWQLQPNVRLLWTPSEGHTFWSAVSRATRTPALFELEARADFASLQPPTGPPLRIALLPNPDLAAEKLVAYEAGYRVTPTAHLSIDVAAFVNHYDGIILAVPLEPRFESQPPPPHLLIATMESNLDDVHTHGLEVAVQWQPMDRWKLVTAYTWLRMRARPDPSIEQDNPQHQFQVRSYFDVTRAVELNAAAYYVDPISPLLVDARARASSYVRLDLGMTWRPVEFMQLGIWGRNLLEREHEEFGSLTKRMFTEVPRSVAAKVLWSF